MPKRWKAWLVGIALAQLLVIGVDVAPGMLAQAAGKQLYTELHEADVVDFLHADERSWPLILASDVLCYFGALDELFTAVRQRLVRLLARGEIERHTEQNESECAQRRAR